MAVTLGSAVGTIGTVLFYGTATVNLVWQHMGWRALEKGDLRKLYVVDMGLPWISHILCSFIPTFIITKVGTSMVDLMKAYLPMDGVAMKTLFTVGSLLAVCNTLANGPSKTARDKAVMSAPSARCFRQSVSPSCSSRLRPSRLIFWYSYSASRWPLAWAST